MLGTHCADCDCLCCWCMGYVGDNVLCVFAIGVIKIFPGKGLDWLSQMGSRQSLML